MSARPLSRDYKRTRRGGPGLDLGRWKEFATGLAVGLAIALVLFVYQRNALDRATRDAETLRPEPRRLPPDQDGATAAVRAATTLFVVKDADHDVHLAPYHYWNTAHAPQADLFTPPPDPAAAVCRG